MDNYIWQFLIFTGVGFVMGYQALRCLVKSIIFITNGIVGYPTIHYSAMLRYVWTVTEEITVVADDNLHES